MSPRRPRRNVKSRKGELHARPEPEGTFRGAAEPRSSSRRAYVGDSQTHTLPRRIKRVRVSIASPLMQPSPNGRRVGIRIVTFEACSGFTRVTAHRIAQPPKATFVTRLQPRRSPGRAARQLPDQSTTLWVDSSSTGDSRLRGALPFPDIGRRGQWLCVSRACPIGSQGEARS
jgi:hypothetical protein